MSRASADKALEIAAAMAAEKCAFGQRTMNSDTERLDYLERLLKKSPVMWDMVCIETFDGEMRIEACNEHHGDAAGRVTGKTLREAVDKAIAGDFAEALTS